MLEAKFRLGLFENPFANPQKAQEVFSRPEGSELALQIARQSIVLLKNHGTLLPLDKTKVNSIVVIGPNAAEARYGGGGSCFVRPAWAVTPFDGIRARAGDAARVEWALGCVMERENPALETPEARAGLLAEAVDLARRSDIAVVVVGYSHRLETEGFDRPSLDLPAGQDDLVEAVAGANPNTVVIVHSGGPGPARHRLCLYGVCRWGSQAVSGGGSAAYLRGTYRAVCITLPENS